MTFYSRKSTVMRCKDAEVHISNRLIFLFIKLFLRLNPISCCGFFYLQLKYIFLYTHIILKCLWHQMLGPFYLLLGIFGLTDKTFDMPKKSKARTWFSKKKNFIVSIEWRKELNTKSQAIRICLAIGFQSFCMVIRKNSINVVWKIIWNWNGSTISFQLYTSFISLRRFSFPAIIKSHNTNLYTQGQALFSHSPWRAESESNDEYVKGKT